MSKPNRLLPVCSDKAIAGSAASPGVQGDELTDRFLRILTELAVTHCLSGESGAVTMRPGLLYFVAIDAYVRLLVLLINGERGALATSFLGLAGAVSRPHSVKVLPTQSSCPHACCFGCGHGCSHVPAMAAHVGWSAALPAPVHCIQSPCSAVYWSQVLRHPTVLTTGKCRSELCMQCLKVSVCLRP